MKGIEEQRGKGVDRGKVLKNREEKEQIDEKVLKKREEKKKNGT